MDIRNIAIIAHVDHGKTTLVDALLKAGSVFQDHEIIDERVMDSNNQEKERGITIYAKNTAIFYKDTKINIVDTPGHADFGSEVERILGMVDAALLVVDAYEGPMPQTKFVLSKSLALGMKIMVVINKIDKPTARADQVLDMTFDLFDQLGATDEQLDFSHLYAVARDGIAVAELDDEQKDISPLLDAILEHVPVSPSDTEAPFRMQPATLQYDNYLGRIAVGRVHSGTLKTNQGVTVITQDKEKRRATASKLYTYEGLQKKEVSMISAGDIVALAGVEDIYIGETISTDPDSEPLPTITVDPPTLAMEFLVNDSPMAGKSGKFLTSRHIRDRLYREVQTNVGLRVEDIAGTENFKVYGRGEMHLAVLIEDMRREGFELQVSQPEVVMQEINGKKHEPFEHVVISLPDEMCGKVMETLSDRKGEMQHMNSENGITQLEFLIPMRGLIGYRSVFTLLTRGEGTFYHSFSDFRPYAGEIKKRSVGAMISGETGKAVGYALFNLQDRGALFISPGTEVYEGMVIGEHNQGSDLQVNPLKEKKLTNVRASGTDEAIKLIPPIDMTLEKALEYMQDDEYVEVTPEHIRLRKQSLKSHERKKKK